jgi:hypothetical protein
MQIQSNVQVFIPGSAATSGVPPTPGSDRITETGDKRITESGDQRVTE